MPTTKDIAPNTLGLVFSLLLLFGFFQADAQCDSTAGGYSLSIELLHENIGIVGDNGSSTDLSGFNTYRVYLECEDPADKLSAIEGNDNRPLNVSSTTGFYQTSLFSGSANALPNFISPILYSTFPEMVYDSWVTIGIEETADSEANETEVKLTEDSSNPISNGFASGNDLIVNSEMGSAWYIQDSDNYSNGLAGADSKVLVAQLTTDGQISGQLGMQVFRNGISTTENCVRPYLSFQSHGCMESSACNYAPTAIIDDGSCDFCSCPDSIQVLSASFPNDSVPAFSLEVEIIADHDTTDINTNFSGTPDPLAGMKTYRVYAQVDNASTLVTAGFGGTTAPLAISSTEPFYQSQLGGTTPSNNSASLFDISPYKDLRYDSWVTIGIDRAPSQMPASSSGLNYTDISVAGGWPGEFNNGGGLYASGAVGGTWFAFPSSANVIPDENLRVLIAQFTTAGVVSGTLGLQIVPETAPSDSTNDYRLPFNFTTDGLGEYTPIFPEICSCENVDNDYLCDDVDPCVGSEDACGICNGPGEIYECGCADIPTGDCDCDGNQTDAIGVCGGACTHDDDNNGVCDDSEIPGCMDGSASNYDNTATQDNGSCFYNGCTDPNASNYDDTADTNDGSCIYPGCTDPNAWNYDPGANQNDGSCQANACGVDGVLVEVTNYAFTPSSVSIPVGGTVVWQNNSSSLHNVNGDIDTQAETSFGNPEAFGLPNSVGNAQGACMGAVTFNVPGQYQYDCSIGIHAALGMVAFITVGDGGCTDVTATNYDSSADYDNGSCTFAGCTDSSACNYDPSASSNDGSCVFVDGVCETCEGGTIVDNDADNDGVCDGDETTGCTNSAACNFDANPTTDTNNSLCIFATGCQTCSGESDGTGSVINNDADSDGVCDANEIEGCTNPTACNYDATPTTDTDNNLCVFPSGCETCSGENNGSGTVVDNDTDNDGVCDQDEELGCTNPAACNYDADPTTDPDNSLCTFAEGCETCSGETDGTGTVVDNDADNDGVCNADEVQGCTDSAACNYDSDPTTDTDNSLCTYTDGNCETCINGLIVDNDADNDGVCNADEVQGCTDPAACNYDADPTTDTDNALCAFPTGCETCSGETDGTGSVVDNDADNDGICNADEVLGCTNPAACNYDADPTTDTDNSLCAFPTGCETCSGETDGTGTVVDNDADNDGVCNADEVQGCTDPAACNYDADPTTDTDNALCAFPTGCETCSGETDGTGSVVDNDADNDGVCNADEVQGCTDPAACNYDADPTTDTDNALCAFPTGCETCSGETDGTGTVVDNDADNDGVCNADEVLGCTNPAACNYDSDPTTDTDNALCAFPTGCETCSGETDGTGSVVDNDADNDGVCNADEVLGCTNPTACNYDADPTTDTDNSLCTYTDGNCETCINGLIVDNDADNDGVCNADEVQGCTDPAACNYDADPTTDTDNALCAFPTGCETCSGETDGTGSVVDNDADNDGVCNADEVQGCTDPAACNYDADPTTDTDNALCAFPTGCETCSGETDGTGSVVDNDADNDGVCNADEVQGCTDPAACNYDADPTTDTDNALCAFPTGCETCSGETDGTGSVVDNDADNDGVCNADEVQGCTDPAACNYDADPTTDTDNALCAFPTGCETCSGETDGTGSVVDNDADNDGVCNADEVQGCTDPAACNYDADPTTDTDNALCAFPTGCETCSGETDGTGSVVDNDADNDGICNADEVLGCTNPAACNYDADPTTDTDNSLCAFPTGCETCSGETDGTGSVVDNDADNDGVCNADEVQGCTDPAACNYDADPTTDTDNALCAFPTGCETCSGETDGTGSVVDNDADNDGICNADEVLGCTNPAACNYDADPTTDTDNSLCAFPAGCETCSGETDGTGSVVDNDADNDGVCNADEVQGCTDPAACNYDADPTTDTDNALCAFPAGCETCSGETDGTGSVVDNDADNDGVCNADEVQGCTDPAACNYDADPTTDTDNALCAFPTGCETCSGETDGTGSVVDNDADNDGVCNADEILGCTDSAACNYDADPTTDTDNSLCTYTDGICETCVNGLIVDNDADEDGVCNNDEVMGCTDPNACNVGDFSDTDNSLCTYADGSCQTCENGIVLNNDADNDGVCDADEVLGCTNPAACNYDSDPTTDTDDALCAFPTGCETCSGETDGTGTVVDNDADNDGICNADEVLGCTNPAACNYDSDPTTDTDNALCAFPTGCETCSGETDGTGTVVDNDADNDGVCNADEVLGCTNPAACNYDSDPTTDTDNALCAFPTGCETCSGETDGTGTVVDNDADNDGVCNADEVLGCTDSAACNYDSDPTTDTDDALCAFPTGCETCSGETDGTGTVVDNDADNDGVCNADEVLGCTNPAACNYDSDPTTDTDDALCAFPTGCETCSGETDGTGSVVDNDADNDGVCNADEILGCTDSAACNYDADPTTDTDNSLCTFTDGICETCVNGLIVDNDADEDGVCDNDEVAGCNDPNACNVGDFSDTDNSLCTYADGPCQTCENGIVLNNDDDNDGVCNADEILGCTDSAACNYDSDPTTDTDNSLCTFTDGICETCVNGLIVDNDADEDGVCDNDEVAGCNDPNACNVGDFSDTDNSLCNYADGPCQTCENGIVVNNDADSDGVCDADEITGCTNPAACNFDGTSTTDTENSLCTFPTGCETCSGATDGTGTVVDNDADNDGVCNADEVLGCTDSAACNYDANPTTDADNSLCTYADGPCQTCENGIVVNNDADSDGVCDADEITGCTNPAACNFDGTSTTDTDNSLCAFPTGCETCSGATDGTGTVVDNDADNDGVCNADEVLGCTDSAACNYDANPTTDADNSLCTYADGPCQTCENGIVVNNDADSDGVCDADEITGCTNPAACNFDGTSTTDTDNSLCAFPTGCETCSGETDGSGIIIGNDTDLDGVCDQDEVSGCENETACNYSPLATDDDGSCEFTSCIGCTDETACNFDIDATEDDASCTYAESGLDCDGNCLNDANNNGICDEDEGDCPDFNQNGICDNLEVYGCTYSGACNFQMDATADDGSCTYPAYGFNCDGSSIDGSTDYAGCTYSQALNYSSAANVDDGSCVFSDSGEVGACLFDVSNDGTVNTPDLLIFLSLWESTCE